MDKLPAILLIAVTALVTIGLRFLPFLIFGENRKTPAAIAYLGQVLPYAIMGMLVIYCFKDISFASYPHGLPAIIAGVAVALLHLWKGNTLLSVFGGTALYMVLINFVFK